jgi:hypothetical protein
MKIPYESFNKILEDNRVHLWLEEYLFNRLGISVKVIYDEAGFTLIFNNDVISQKIFFSRYGRDELFKVRPTVNYISEILIKKQLELDLSFNLALYCKTVDEDNFFKFEDGILIINYDVISTIIFTLNRIEEYGYVSKEKHNRFLLKDSILRFDSLYERPIIDEWILFLSKVLEKYGFPVVQNNFSFRLSHDVDNISRYNGVPFIRLILTCFYDLFKQPEKVINYFLSRKKFIREESINTFDWIMDISEKFGKISNFYFLVGNTSLRYDFRYIYNLFVLKLISKIHKRGHNIGIHYSYSSSKLKMIQSEWNKIIKITNELGIIPKGGRMHYLRIDFLESLCQLEQTNQEFDETITFHETGGFRAGTCFSYSPFNFMTLKEFNFVIKPLILMEASAFYYLQLDNSKSLEYIMFLVNQCKKVNGEFTLLWHNSELNTNQKVIYHEAVKYCYELEKSSS